MTFLNASLIDIAFIDPFLAAGLPTGMHAPNNAII